MQEELKQEKSVLKQNGKTVGEHNEVQKRAEQFFCLLFVTGTFFLLWSDKNEQKHKHNHWAAPFTLDMHHLRPMRINVTALLHGIHYAYQNQLLLCSWQQSCFQASNFTNAFQGTDVIIDGNNKEKSSFIYITRTFSPKNNIHLRLLVRFFAFVCFQSKTNKMTVLKILRQH